MTNNAGNYVLAGVDTFVTLLGGFIDKHSKELGKDYFDDKKLSYFLNNTINRYLLSYGTGLSYKSKKLNKKQSIKIQKMLDVVTERDFMKETKIYMDSGGFQVAMGAVKTNDMPTFITMYHDFIKNNIDKVSYFFNLDLPPGPESNGVFSDYNQLEKLNRLSYQTSQNLPQNIKDKMIYIHHFRTPNLYRTWNKFLFDEDLANGFVNMGTGGIVANMGSDMRIPIIVYTIPLSSVLKWAKNKKLKKFNFHILGGANFIDIVYHKLFSYHIKQYHNIDVNITYDSSAVFKGLTVGRFIAVMKKNNSLVKMDLRSKTLHLNFDGSSIEDTVYRLVNEIASIYNFIKLKSKDEPIYDKERNTFHRATYMYLIMYVLKLYRDLENLADKFVKQIYPLYKNNNIEKFDFKCKEFTRNLNQGKLSKKQLIKSYSIYKSLKILENLDEDYNKYLVDKFMSADDMSNVSNKGIEL